MQVLRRQKRVQRLSHFHSDCELNYARLRKLIGDCSSGSYLYQSREWGEGKEIELSIEITQESRYTRMLRIRGTMSFLPLAGAQTMHVRVYDDARMVEVISMDRKRVRLINYFYPNKDMYAPDEKNQLNHFLGRWLEHMLSNGLPEKTSIQKF